MNNSNNTNDSGIEGQAAFPKSLGDWMEKLYPYRKKIIVTSFFITVATVAFLFLTKPWYESQAVILLPDKSSSAIESLGGALGGIGQTLLSGSGISGPQRYLAILRSQRLKEAIIARFKLIDFFEMEPTRKDTSALLELMEESIFFESNVKNSTISIQVRFQGSPEMTADITNFAVSELDRINRELSTDQARFSRQFIEKRYYDSRIELKKAEDSLNFFQKRHGIIALTEQTKASIETAADIQAQLVTGEAEYNIIRKSVGDNHPDAVRQKSRLDELRRIQNKMDVGGFNQSILIPFNSTADIALQYLRLFREVQINQKIVEYLIPQFEQTKIQEAKDTPTVQVLDYGKPAAYPVKPKKKIITIIVGFLSLVLTSLFYVVNDIIRVSDMSKQNRVTAIFKAFHLKGSTK
ncbi:MAG TPA: GNVR domain-containing protein [bacterium]|nr:GNVR domain-containing protein [bacterium]HMY36374.1 GNVR domain-containing protein [bacterium]HNB08420.1 GNVR domain-containing protein [bacterium]HNC47426.1 GNVR domain-containing protein [bacterium]HND77251.1 GNVR domain-containing protein [bacterium]